MEWVDQETMKALGLSSLELMRRVSEEIAEKLLSLSKEGDSFLFLLGAGNNAGDGYCVSEILRKQKRFCYLLPVLEPQSPAAQSMASEAKSKKLSDWPSSKIQFIVDAVAGNRSRSLLEAKTKAVFKKANSAKAFRVAIDCPTGVDTESGEASSEAFRADLTLAVAYPKEVFAQESVAECTGAIELIGSDFATPRTHRMSLVESDFEIFTRKKTAYKKGRCGVLAGSASSPGAAFLCAEAAQRVGAGYVQLFFENRESLGIDFQNASFQYAENFEEILKASLGSLVVGCGGLPRAWKKVEALDCPQVFDAEALRQFDQSVFRARDNRLLTPHWGEAASLLQKETLDGSSDREEVLKELVSKTGHAVYLKGAPGLLGFPEDIHDKYYVNLSIQPVFATAGSGDVLSGILGGVLALQRGSFRESVIAALSFQKELGEVLSDLSAALSTDQLQVFSEVLKRIRRD